MHRFEVPQPLLGRDENLVILDTFTEIFEAKSSAIQRFDWIWTTAELCTMQTCVDSARLR